MRQILVETHRAPKGTAQEFFQYLHDKGYVIFHKEPNIQYGGGEFDVYVAGSVTCITQWPVCRVL